MTRTFDGMASVLRGHQRELVCTRCLNLVASVALRPFQHPEVTHASGPAVHPMSTGMAEGLAKTRLAAARAAARDPLFAHDPELPAAIRDGAAELAYLDQQAGERVYELCCTGCGARYLRSMPHLSRMVRRAPADRVPLR